MTFFLGMIVGALAVIFVPHMWEKWGPKSKKGLKPPRTLGRGGQ